MSALPFCIDNYIYLQGYYLFMDYGIVEYLIYETGMPESRAIALVEKMRLLIGVVDLEQFLVHPDINLSEPNPDPTNIAKASPEKAFMQLVIYILENR